MANPLLTFRDNQDFGNPLPDTVKGALTLICGLTAVAAAINGAYVVTLAGIIALYAAFSWRKVVDLDLHKRTYTTLQGPWLFRTGTPIPLGTPEYVALITQTRHQGGSFLLLSSSDTNSTTVVLLAASESDDLLPVLQGKDQDRLLEEATALAAYLNVPVHDHRITDADVVEV